MRSKLSVLLMGIFFQSCVSVSEHPSNFAAAKENLEESETIFPNIEAIYRTSNLNSIEAYSTQLGIQEIENERVRLFIQPMGIVSKAIEVNLDNSEIIVYPGTHGEEEALQKELDTEEMAKIKSLVLSSDFRKIPSENKKIGFDGVAYLVEVSIGEEYYWKLHWEPDDHKFTKVVQELEAISK